MAKAVQDKKAHDAALVEQKRHNRNLEAAARGQGLEDIGRTIDAGFLQQRKQLKILLVEYHKFQKKGRRYLRKLCTILIMRLMCERRVMDYI